MMNEMNDRVANAITEVNQMEVELNLCGHADDNSCDAVKLKTSLLIRDNMPSMTPVHLPKNRHTLNQSCCATVFYHNGVVYKMYDIASTEWIREISTLIYVAAYQHSSFIWANSFTLDRVYMKCNPVDEYLTPRYCCAIELPYYDHSLVNEIGMSSDKHMLQIFVDILEGVAFLHDRDIMHRDLKLANIMIHGDRAKIIDFSHAFRRRVKHVTLDKYVATYDHRAPEVFAYNDENSDNKEPYTESIDVWAIGMMLFQVVTGLAANVHICKDEKQTEAIFTNTEESYMAIISDLYKLSMRPSKLKYADTYFTWIVKMLKKDPSQRITAKAMLTEIIAFCENNNIDVQLATYSGMDQEVFEDVNEQCDCVEAECDNFSQHCFSRYALRWVFFQHFNDPCKICISVF
jgi:serine/threonine protein kinase